MLDRLQSTGRVYKRHYPRWMNTRGSNELFFICREEVLLWRLSDEEHLEEYLSMGSFSKMFGKSVATSQEESASDADFSRRWPMLALLMMAAKGDDGRPRQTATLTFVCEGGLWKAGVKDKDHSMSLWRSGETMTAVLDSLEKALDDGTADWKVQEGGRRSGKS